MGLNKSNRGEAERVGYGNCLDYLQRRGVLPFRVAPFCPVDDLILSLCAYLPFEQVLPGPRQGDWVPFPQAVEALTQRPGWDAVGLIMAKDTPALVRQAARSPRFQTLGLGCAAGVLDQQTQFAALTFRLPDSTLYLAFRGTDDTLVGWKECFAMSYAFPVPAQALAQDYLVQVAQRHPGRLRVGGHSKGGNLAVWAALHAPPLLRRRILRVTSHDGPGFGQDLTRTRAYGALAPRLVTYIPQASLVGTLLHQDPRAQIIQSHGVGTVGQHDPFSWTVRGTGFVSLPRRSRRGDRESAGFRGWVDALSPADQLTLEVARMVREDFLQQNAFADVDSFSSYDRQEKLLAMVLRYDRLCREAISKGAPVAKLFAVPSREKIGRAKSVPAEEYQQVYQQISAEMEQEITAIAEEGGEDA